MKEKIKKYLTKWESVYNGIIPDESPTRLEDLGKAPSYRLICKNILKNDYQCETLGFQRSKPLIYHDLKKIELSQRGIYIQLELFQ